MANGSSAADNALRFRSSAVVAHNDLLAFGIMHRLAARGLRVPEDASVVGFDNIFATTLTQPTLTTLGGPSSDAARRAVDLLLGAIEARAGGSQGEPTHITMPTELVVRDSSGPAPGTWPPPPQPHPWRPFGVAATTPRERPGRACRYRRALTAPRPGSPAPRRRR